MKRSILTAIFSLLFATGVTASNPFTIDVTQSIATTVSKLEPKLVSAWIEKALACDKPGTHVLEPGGDNGDGVVCNENGRIHGVNGGVNRGLIERLKAAGVPVVWLRAQLSNPEVLKVIDRQAEPLISAAVDAFVTGPYAHYIFERAKIVDGVIDLSGEEHLKEWLREFVLRRLREANVNDRPEIARIWGEIIEKQLRRYVTGGDEKLLPSYLRQRQ